jgi:K+-transporting ATPase c subunit
MLERKDLNAQRELRGVAGNLAVPMFTILGISVVTDAGTSFKDASGSDITSAAFFAQADGQLVKASGNWNGSNLVATSVEIDNP